jgi:protein-S-isoprenylcysteine O-methyltransferase Ste14
MSQVVKPARRIDTERLFLVPALVMLLLISVVELGSQWSSGAFSEASGALTAVHRVLRILFYVLMVSLLLIRKESRSSAPSRRATVAAYVGTFTPFLLMLNGESALASGALTAVSILVITLGLGFSVYSLGWLGRSFGVVPQARDLVRSGPYRFVRHPLYVGEFVSFAGAVMAVITPFSALVFVFFVFVQTYRATQEEKVLRAVFPEYESYMGQAGRFVPRLSR